MWPLLVRAMYDVVIVGAGPSGSTAARKYASIIGVDRNATDVSVMLK